MKLIKVLVFGAIAAALAACSGAETVTRNAPLETPRVGVAEIPQITRDYSLQSIRFVFPDDMTVSEAN